MPLLPDRYHFNRYPEKPHFSVTAKASVRRWEKVEGAVHALKNDHK